MEETFRRNLFEVENARNLSSLEIVKTFVPTSEFWRLLSPKNHIVLGARGSGKTELVRMLAHDHLVQYEDERCKEIIREKKFIGMYVPTRLEWVGSLKNKQWGDEAEAEAFFQWKLNISTCAAFLITLRSCLDTYVLNDGDRARTERDLARELYKTWFDNNQSCETVSKLYSFLEDVEHEKQDQLTQARTTGNPIPKDQLKGSYFENGLFIPLRRAITLATRALSFPSHTMWLLCLDEAEFLEKNQHKILNSHLRTFPGNLVFKITTMPYHHHTLETNTNACLSVGHDFDYIYIDKDPLEISRGDDGIYKFAKALFNKRAKESEGDYEWKDFEALLGSSILLDPKISEWDTNPEMKLLLREYANPVTIERAVRIAGTPGFNDQIARKMSGALLLKDAVKKIKGRSELDVYSGTKMSISCSDANPRRLIRIFNLFITEAINKKSSHIKESRQTLLLVQFSASSLSRVQSEPKNGQDLYKFLNAIGNYMKRSLHDNLIGTDQISSIEIDKSVTDKEWEVVKIAVGLGLLYPNVNANSSDQMPERSGIFRLAYVLAPHFRILPRKGKSVSISRISQQLELQLAEK